MSTYVRARAEAALSNAVASLAAAAALGGGGVPVPSELKHFQCRLMAAGEAKGGVAAAAGVQHMDAATKANTAIYDAKRLWGLLRRHILLPAAAIAAGQGMIGAALTDAQTAAVVVALWDCAKSTVEHISGQCVGTVCHHASKS